MKPTNIDLTGPDDRDAIDRLLFEDAARALADEGFSARVMGALPPPAPRTQPMKLWLIAGSAALGSILAFTLSPASASILTGFADLSAARFMTPAAMGALATAVALAITAVIVAAETE